jgi:GNAT superfamily N-acetyltransferase
MDLFDLDRFTDVEEAAIVGDEQAPWGGEPAESLIWRDKRRYVAARDEQGEPVGVAGAVIAEVEVDGGELFQVVGLGGLIVAARHRREGLGGRLMRRLLEIASQMGPARAMLFCNPSLVDRYRREGFVPIDAPVFAEQPSGRIEMPLEAMWRPLGDGVAWPEGRVDVLGLPF